MYGLLGGTIACVTTPGGEPDLLGAATVAGLRAVVRGDRLEVTVPWRPGRPYWERPVLVVELDSSDLDLTPTAAIVTRAWFWRLWAWGTAVAVVVVLIMWLAAGHHLGSTATAPGALILVLPVAFGLVGAALRTVDRLRLAGEGQRLAEFAQVQRLRLRASESPG